MFKYRSYTDIPEWIKNLLLRFVGETDIRELTLSEINGYLNNLLSSDTEMEDFK